MAEQKLMHVPLGKIRFRKDKQGLLNPRSHTDTTDLQANLKEYGQIEPIVVIYKSEEDFFEVQSGHKRTIAARALGWKTLMAIVTTDDDRFFLKLVSANLYTPLTPMQQAQVALRLASPPNSHNKKEIATALGCSMQKLNLLLDLLKAPESIQARVGDGRLSLSSFKVIAKESGPRQVQVVEEIKAKNPDGKATAQSIRAAKQRIETEEKGTRIAGDEMTVAQHFNVMRQHIEKLQAMCPLSPAETLAATYQLGETVKELRALKETM